MNTIPEIGTTVALDTPYGPCGKVTHINPAVAPPDAEVRIVWADRALKASWLPIDRLVTPEGWDGNL